MSFADEVRAYCGKQIIEPARQRGDREVRIRAGDIHQDLNYKNRVPLVCSALGATVFEDEFGVRRVAVEGPLNGANTIFRFAISP